MTFRLRGSTAVLAAALAAVVGLLLAVPASATAATSVAGSLSFSGSGTSMKMVTSVKFTSTYAGSYVVKYDIYRSTSSSKSSPVKVNTSTVFTKSFSTTKGTTSTYGPNTSN